MILQAEKQAACVDFSGNIVWTPRGACDLLTFLGSSWYFWYPDTYCLPLYGSLLLHAFSLQQCGLFAGPKKSPKQRFPFINKHQGVTGPTSSLWLWHFTCWCSAQTWLWVISGTRLGITTILRSSPLKGLYAGCSPRYQSLKPLRHMAVGQKNHVPNKKRFGRRKNLPKTVVNTLIMLDPSAERKTCSQKTKKQTPKAL